MHRAIRRLGDASARRPWAVVAAWVAAAVVVLGLAATSSGAFVDDFVAPGSESEQAMQLLEERFPDAAQGTALAVLRAPAGEEVSAYGDVLADVADGLASVERVTRVGEPLAEGSVAPDGRTAYLLVTFDTTSTDVGPEPVEALREALEPARDAGLVAEVGGDAAFINAETETSGAEVAGVVAALVVLVVAFGTVVAALVPVALALLAVGIGVGAVVVLTNVMDVSSAGPTIGAMIGLGVGIDYALIVVARYRENRAAGQPDGTALSRAMETAGSSVLFAGGTVVLAMAALVLTGIPVLGSIGMATSLVVLVSVAAALTLLPALLSLLGGRVDAGRLRRRRRGSVRLPASRTPQRGGDGSFWWRFAHVVARRPLPWLVAGGAALLLLAAPSLSMQTGFPDAGDDAETTSHRVAYDMLTEGFGPGFNGPMVLVVDLARDGVDAAGIDGLRTSVAQVAGVAAVGEPLEAPSGDAVTMTVLPTTAPADLETTRTLERLRDTLPANVMVSGLTALTADVTAQLADSLPVFIAAVVGASFLLLLLLFRSVLIPLKAAVMNLLSIGAAYGVVVAVFQWGWFAGLLGIESTMPIVSPMPAIFFAVLFGLSMDYEVFLLSRVKEEYDATSDATESVARGLAGTGRVITSAALIMTVVFGSFVANPSPLVTMMGLGLATAIVLDATVVRMVLVPATMALLGRRAWWLPAWLDRRLPHVAAEPDAAAAAAGAAATAGSPVPALVELAPRRAR